MSPKKLITMLLLPVFIISCNYKLFVDKRYVVQEQKGYLIFNNSQIAFFPTKDTIDANFLAAAHHKEGYRVEYDTDWLDSLSTDYSRLLYIKNDKRLSVIPVEITYYLGGMWRPISDKSTVDYKWNNTIHVLQYETADWRQILSIYPVRKSDIRRIKDLHMPVDTTKVIPSHWHPVE